jgi:mannose-6-phosphate isomerase-like protein (cupin superfamily)
LNSELEEKGRGTQERGVTRILDISNLLHGETAYAFQGHHYGDTNVSFFLVDARPGSGPKLHKHPYEEVLVVQEGTVTFTVGDDVVEARGGQVVVVPSGAPQKFVNSGADRLRQVNIHASGLLPSGSKTDLGSQTKGMAPVTPSRSPSRPILSL